MYNIELRIVTLTAEVYIITTHNTIPFIAKKNRYFKRTLFMKKLFDTVVLFDNTSISYSPLYKPLEHPVWDQ